MLSKIKKDNLSSQAEIKKKNFVEKNCGIILISILIISVLAWTLLPALLLKGTYIDILESLVWGRHFDFGYDKNPYFVAWVTRFFYDISGEKIWSLYLMSQISVALCLWAVWRLAKNWFPPVHALIAACSLLMIDFFNVGATEFNDNVLELSMWGLGIYFFYKAARNPNYRNWMLAGLFVALSVMTKYLGLFLLFGMFIYTVVDKDARKNFSRPYMYAGLIVFLIFVIPNIIWLFQNDFITITYAFQRANTSQNIMTFVDHFVKPMSFAGKMISRYIIFMVIGVLYFLFSWKKRIKFSKKTDWIFILIVGYTPFVLSFLFSVLTGSELKLHWGQPFFILAGVVFIGLLRPRLDLRECKIFFIILFVAFIVEIIGFVNISAIRPYYKGKGRYENFPGKAIAAYFTDYWRKTYHTPLAYVAGNRDLTCNTAIFSKDHPAAYFSWDPLKSNWINEKDFRRKGAIFMYYPTDGKPMMPAGIPERFPNAKPLGVFKFNWSITSFFKKMLNLKPILPTKIAIAILPPSSTIEKKEK